MDGRVLQSRLFCYDYMAPARSGVGFDRPGTRYYSVLFRSTFLGPFLWWAVQELSKGHRFYRDGTVNSAQSATLLFDRNGGGF